MSKPIVAIIGRQNVGKSTLLNRLSGKRLAIVEDQPGTTRDRIFANVSWQDTRFSIVDTGGLATADTSSIAREVTGQAETAIAEADVIIFLVDVREGIMPGDRDITDKLRRAKKPVLLVANKADNDSISANVAEFNQLGLGEPLAISAYHGRGSAELLDKLIALMPPSLPEDEKPEVMRVAIAGRPGVGKSMLLNAILGKERAIVGDRPGTTRDAVDTGLDFQGQNVVLIDTAGIRRRGQIQAGVEQYSVLRALRAIDRCDVSLFVLDATSMVADQDTHVAGYIQQAEKGMVVVVNKWDLVKDGNPAEYGRHIKARLKFMAHAPVLYVSALLRQGVERVMPQAYQVYQERIKRLSTAVVNDVVQKAVASHNLPASGGKQLRIFYATQAEVSPPTFAIFVNDAKLVHFSYKRYLENRLRAAFGFDGTPIRLVFRGRGEKRC